MGIIEDAIKSKKQLAFDYINKYEEKGTHRVFPLRIETNKKGERQLVTTYLGGKTKKKKVQRWSYIATGEQMTPKFTISKMTNVRIATFWDKIFI